MEVIPIKRLQMSGSRAWEPLVHAPRRLEARLPIRSMPTPLMLTLSANRALRVSGFQQRA